MSEFTKTFVVDADGSGDYKYINQATLALASTGGTIIVEQGTYTIDGDFDDSDPTDIIDRRTASVPSNVTIIGRGNAVSPLSVTS